MFSSCFSVRRSRFRLCAACEATIDSPCLMVCMSGCCCVHWHIGCCVCNMPWLFVSCFCWWTSGSVVCTMVVTGSWVGIECGCMDGCPPGVSTLLASCGKSERLLCVGVVTFFHANVSLIFMHEDTTFTSITNAHGEEFQAEFFVFIFWWRILFPRFSVRTIAEVAILYHPFFLWVFVLDLDGKFGFSLLGFAFSVVRATLLTYVDLCVVWFSLSPFLFGIKNVLDVTREASVESPALYLALQVEHFHFDVIAAYLFEWRGFIG